MEAVGNRLYSTNNAIGNHHLETKFCPADLLFSVIEGMHAT